MNSLLRQCSLVLVLFTATAAWAASATPTGPTQPTESTYAPPSQKTPLGTIFVDWDSIPVRTTASGFSRAVFDNPTPTLEKFEMHITTLNGGMTSHPVHHHAWEEMLLVKEGTVEVSINGQLQRAGPGALIFYASHDVHNIKNADAEKPATYYVMNFYTDLVHTAVNKPAAEQAVPGKLPSSIIDCNRLPATPTPTGSRVSVVNSPTLTFLMLGSHITTLTVGQSTQAEMIDSGDELFIVKAGILEVTVNGVTARLKEGSFFYCAPNDKRTLKNIGTTPASYHVIKVVSAKSPK
ncbi:MAG TPA: cupin domain-containing protein [Opitutaceae bacterium]|nr:cupin domain-containing protein [Opitutaceae bacterium]